MPEKKRILLLKKAKDWALQSIVAAKDIFPDTVITRSMIAFKRPGKGGLSPQAVNLVLGKKAKTFIEEDKQISLKQLK